MRDGKARVARRRPVHAGARRRRRGSSPSSRTRRCLCRDRLRAFAAVIAHPGPALMIRLLAIDIDGTLLDGQGRMPDAHRDALVEASARGIEIALATGRSFHFTARGRRPPADPAHAHRQQRRGGEAQDRGDRVAARARRGTRRGASSPRRNTSRTASPSCSTGPASARSCSTAWTGRTRTGAATTRRTRPTSRQRRRRLRTC